MNRFLDFITGKPFHAGVNSSSPIIASLTLSLRIFTMSVFNQAQQFKLIAQSALSWTN